MVARRAKKIWSEVRIYVEGGGETRAQQSPLRIGFGQLFTRHLDALPRPRVIACGGRSTAYREFINGLEANPDALCILLVDSEGPVGDAVPPWTHVATRDGDRWERRPGIADDQLHLMTESMEAWIVADAEALETFYKQGFLASALPRREDLEAAPKRDLYSALERATCHTRKGSYSKDHGFALIGTVDPAKIVARCPRHGARFFAQLTALMTQLAARATK